MADHERLFDAWGAGGVDGIVIGPMAFEDKTFTFDPNPEVYRRFGVEPPPATTQDSLWWKRPDQDGRHARPTRRNCPETRAAGSHPPGRQRPWLAGWLFCPHYGTGPGGGGPIMVDEQTRLVNTARLVDCMERYPMADGAVFDGPEWGYEIAPFHQNGRSSIFNDLPQAVAEGAARLGYDYQRMVAAKDRLFARLHSLTERDVGIWCGSAARPAPHKVAVACSAPSACWATIPPSPSGSRFVWTRSPRRRPPGRAGPRKHPAQLQDRRRPRSAAWSSLCGYDYGRLGDVLDVMLCKHYFWHREFDGLYGTVARYVQTLHRMESRSDRARRPPICQRPLRHRAARHRNPTRLRSRFRPSSSRPSSCVRPSVPLRPWVTTPSAWCPGWMPAASRTMASPSPPRSRPHARGGPGCRPVRFLYHHHGNLTPGEWAVISARCGPALAKHHPSPLPSLEG